VLLSLVLSAARPGLAHVRNITLLSVSERHTSTCRWDWATEAIRSALLLSKL